MTARVDAVIRDICGTYEGANKHRNSGERSCEPCRGAYNAHQCAYRAANPEKFRDYDFKRPTHRHLQRSPNIRRSAHLQTRYGITADQWQEIFDFQDRSCACCRSSAEHDRSKAWQVDHNHATHQIRGIVCARCNRLVGQLGDDAPATAVWLTRILAYLASSGDALTAEETSEVLAAVAERREAVLHRADTAHPDRAPLPRHPDVP